MSVINLLNLLIASYSVNYLFSEKFSSVVHYHTPTKLWEGNVFIRVCLSCPLSIHAPSPQICSNLFNLNLNVHGPRDPPPHTHPPSDLFTLIPYKACVVGKQAAGILLECFLVCYKILWVQNVSSLFLLKGTHQVSSFGRGEYI